MKNLLRTKLMAALSLLCPSCMMYTVPPLPLNLVEKKGDIQFDGSFNVSASDLSPGVSVGLCAAPVNHFAIQGFAMAQFPGSASAEFNVGYANRIGKIIHIGAFGGYRCFTSSVDAIGGFGSGSEIWSGSSYAYYSRFQFSLKGEHVRFGIANTLGINEGNYRYRDDFSINSTRVTFKTLLLEPSCQLSIGAENIFVYLQSSFSKQKILDTNFTDYIPFGELTLSIGLSCTIKGSGHDKPNEIKYYYQK